MNQTKQWIVKRPESYDAKMYQERINYMTHRAKVMLANEDFWFAGWVIID